MPPLTAWVILTFVGVKLAQITSERGGSKLQRAAQTKIKSSAKGTKVIGETFLIIENLFILPIALSTCIHRLAIAFVFKTFLWLICSIPELDGGISRVAPHSKRSSLMVNLRSAIMTSPGSTSSKKPG